MKQYVLYFILWRTKKNFFFVKLGIFVWNWEKNILFGIGNGVEFRPENQVIESPAEAERALCSSNILRHTVCLILAVSPDLFFDKKIYL